LKSGEISESAKITLRILKNEEKGPKRDWVILNAAAAILVGEEEKDFSGAIDAARKSIESGAAYEKLEGLIKIKQ
jgi:anthranilate phosphoribosyltransferase